MKVLAKVVARGLFFIGILSLVALIVYLGSMAVYVFSTAGSPGLIAYTPKWIFIFSVFSLLGKTKLVFDH